MLIQAFWYYTVTEEIQRILGEAKPRFVFLNWAQIKKTKTKKNTSKQTKKSTNKQTKKRQQWQQKNLHQK